LLHLQSPEDDVTTRSKREPLSRRTFTLNGKQVEVERGERLWRLTHAGQIIETRNLSAGIEELVGKSKMNFDGALQILEWQASCHS
jgi:hypothetical protein